MKIALFRAFAQPFESSTFGATTMSAKTVLEIRPGLRLRDWQYGDEDAIVTHGNDVEVSRWLRDRFPSPYTRQDAHGWIMMNQDVLPTANFAIELHGSAVGGVGIVFGEDIHRFTAEVGYWVGRSVWGQNIATQAVQTMCTYAFDRLRLVRLYASVFAGNAASARVLEKCGFQLEGTRRKAGYKSGFHFDTHEYARIADE